MKRTVSFFLHREIQTLLYGLSRQNTSCKRAKESRTNAKGRQPCTEGNRKSQCLVRIFLVVSVLEIGTGNPQADSFQCIARLHQPEDFKLTYKAIAMSLDTTRSSTGTVNGASTLLEDRLGKKLLYLACRHHVHKLIVEKALSMW